MNNNVKLDAAIKRQKIILYTTLQILGIVAILLVGSSFDWLNMKFDINLVKTWNYWNAVIQQILMYTLALIIGFIGRLEKEFLKNEDFHLQMNIYHAYFTQKTDSFTKFIDKIINPRIRKEYYKAYIEKKLYRLENMTIKKDEWRLEYSKALDWMINNPDKDINEYEVQINDKTKFKWQMTCKKYIVKRVNLELLICEMNIEKMCKSFSNYPRINAHVFTWGVRAKDNKNDNYKVENKAFHDIIIKSFQKVLSVGLMALVIGTIAGDPNANELLSQANGWMKLLIKYAIRVFSIVWSYMNGIYMGKGVFESNYLLVIENRNAIFEEYVNWKKQVKEEESDGFKIKKAIYEKQVNYEKTLLAQSSIIEDKKEEAQKILIKKSDLEKLQN